MEEVNIMPEESAMLLGSGEKEDKKEAHAMLNGEETGLSSYMSIDTGDFVRCMAIMHEIGKSMMLLDGEKIRATIEGGAEKTIIKVRTLE